MKHILVVDDDLDFLENIKYIIENFFKDTKVLTTDDGNSVINLCDKLDFDLILLDISMPKISGIKVAQSLQNSKKFKDIPIVFITGESFLDFQKHGFAIGGVDYLQKPVDRNLLLHRVGLYITISNQKRLLKAANNRLQKELDKAVDLNYLHEKMLMQHSKTSVMGEVIGAVAHQWRQPLNSIGTSMMKLETKADLDALSIDDIYEITSNVNRTVQYLSNTIEDFKNFFLSSKERTKVDLVVVINSVLNFLKSQFYSHNIAINFHYDKNQEYKVDTFYNEFRQALLNILTNSKDAIDDRVKKGDKFDAAININLTISQNLIELMVCDNGGGVSEDIIDKIFNPYFSTKFASQGTGIGLYYTKTLIEKFHNGFIRANNIGNGVCFKITLHSSTN
jgi:signal transduction histidine kinase